MFVFVSQEDQDWTSKLRDLCVVKLRVKPKDSSVRWSLIWEVCVEEGATAVYCVPHGHISNCQIVDLEEFLCF